MGIVVGGGSKCAALGCGSGPGKNGAFCAEHWRQLDENLRAPGALKKAVVYLGKKDGFLVDAKVVKASALREDGRGSDYV